VLLRFPGAPSVSPTDASRLLAELTWGRHVFGALPWVSIESTHDRGAERVSADARARLDAFRISTYIPPPYIPSPYRISNSQVVALHPAFRGTLAGYVFSEIDTALKAVRFMFFHHFVILRTGIPLTFLNNSWVGWRHGTGWAVLGRLRASSLYVC
jgi:hypothetical protein